MCKAEISSFEQRFLEILDKKPDTIVNASGAVITREDALAQHLARATVIDDTDRAIITNQGLRVEFQKPKREIKLPIIY